jgi:hypothetical protein
MIMKRTTKEMAESLDRRSILDAHIYGPGNMKDWKKDMLAAFSIAFWLLP